ncbi:hypothetical protein OQZ33_07040 [Pedobacter sp. MC2016-05]|uniref:hypothetical protein n=1 Tax=Pedobacter sp. MC2016-05 TaxID=2994474 RepID=UPI0022475488|nr:hypothetical protein [Pedobacter sp. MC2016-05]MCX2474080.1 hypothetical protein [Pedobacter sp. MC2016-05]
MWYFNNKECDKIEDTNAVGFIYKITNMLTGKIYIGKKILFNSIKTKISKKEKLETKTRKTFKVVKKESDWLSYYGSSKELTADIELLGVVNFRREIVQLCYSKKEMSYIELEWQIKHDVLRNDTYNANILCKFFRRDLLHGR